MSLGESGSALHFAKIGAQAAGRSCSMAKSFKIAAIAEPLCLSFDENRKLAEYGSDLQFPRARALWGGMRHGCLDS